MTEPADHKEAFQQWLDKDHNRMWLLDMDESDVYRLWIEGWCAGMTFAAAEVRRSQARSLANGTDTANT